MKIWRSGSHSHRLVGHFLSEGLTQEGETGQTTQVVAVLGE